MISELWFIYIRDWLRWLGFGLHVYLHRDPALALEYMQQKLQAFDPPTVPGNGFATSAWFLPTWLFAECVGHGGAEQPFELTQNEGNKRTGIPILVTQKWVQLCIFLLLYVMVCGCVCVPDILVDAHTTATVMHLGWGLGPGSYHVQH